MKSWEKLPGEEPGNDGGNFDRKSALIIIGALIISSIPGILHHLNLI